MDVLIEIREKVESLNNEYETVQRDLASTQKDLESADSKLESIADALEQCKAAASQMQSAVHSKVADLVTRCLSAVFSEDAYEFGIEFVEKRNKTEAVLQFKRDGTTVDPLSASGGGVVDVAAFALRVVSLMLATPQPRKILILDEPFRFVSADYRSRVRQLVETLSDELDVQFVMVTHDPQLTIGNVIEL